MTSSRVEVEIPPRSAYVRVVRLAIASLARSAGLGEEAVDDLKIAVSEACANAVISHEASGTDDAVKVHWEQQAENLVIEVLDSAPAPEHEASPLDSAGFSSRKILSLALLDSLVDGFEYVVRPEGGMSARLTLSLPAPAA
jgi:serine/threonine-protein kinase RsbW